MTYWIVYVALVPVQFYLACYCTIAAHEFGHFIADCIFVKPSICVNVGRGRMLLEFNLRGVWFRFRWWPDTGNVAGWVSARAWVNAAIIAAGPLANAICAMVSVKIWPMFAAISMLVVILNLWPDDEGVGDGVQMVKWIRLTDSAEFLRRLHQLWLQP